MKVIPKATAVDWRCPFCRVAVPRGELGKFSLFAWTRAREEHRLRAHPEVDRKEYASRCRARGLRTTVSVMRKRAQSLNRHQAARQSARGVSSSSNVDLARFVPFTWPLLRKNRSGEKRFTLRAAWRCRHCPRCFYQASFARKHRCYKKMKATTRRVKQVQQLRKQAHKYPHGVADELLQRTFDTALRMLSGDALDP